MKCWTHTWAEISLDFTSELWVILVVCVALMSRHYFMSKDQLTTDHSYNPLSTQCPHLLSIFIWTIHLQPRRQVKLLAVKPLTPFPLYSPHTILAFLQSVSYHLHITYLSPDFHIGWQTRAMVELQAKRRPIQCRQFETAEIRDSPQFLLWADIVTGHQEPLAAPVMFSFSWLQSVECVRDFSFGPFP